MEDKVKSFRYNQSGKSVLQTLLTLFYFYFTDMDDINCKKPESTVN